MRYLLDTNILSEQLRPQPNPHVMSKLQLYRHEITTASVVWHELWFGCYRLPVSRRRQKIERFLQDIVAPYIPILPYTQTEAKWHAEERGRLSVIGKPPPFADGQIASIAHVNNLILVTANASDYQMFSGLSVENWFLDNNVT